jgi:hypothetical protein
MPDAETATLLRAVLDDVCKNLSRWDTSTRTAVASNLLDAVRQGRSSIDDLKQAGRRALRRTPTMWRE